MVVILYWIGRVCTQDSGVFFFFYSLLFVIILSCSLRDVCVLRAAAVLLWPASGAVLYRYETRVKLVTCTYIICKAGYSVITYIIVCVCTVKNIDLVQYFSVLKINAILLLIIFISNFNLYYTITIIYRVI